MLTRLLTRKRFSNLISIYCVPLIFIILYIPSLFHCFHLMVFLPPKTLYTSLAFLDQILNAISCMIFNDVWFLWNPWCTCKVLKISALFKYSGRLLNLLFNYIGYEISVALYITVQLIIKIYCLCRKKLRMNVVY